MYVNRVEIAGYLAKKPELRYLPSGTPVANARLGQKQRYQDSSQQWQEHTNWHNLSFYGDLSKVALSFDKRRQPVLEGTIEQRQFTPKDGSQRTVTDIVVRHYNLIAAPRYGLSATAQAESVATGSANGHVAAAEGPVQDDSWPVR
jgi:single-strand DNA-binding protein